MVSCDYMVKCFPHLRRVLRGYNSFQGGRRSGCCKKLLSGMEFLAQITLRPAEHPGTCLTSSGTFRPKLLKYYYCFMTLLGNSWISASSTIYWSSGNTCLPCSHTVPSISAQGWAAVFPFQISIGQCFSSFLSAGLWAMSVAKTGNEARQKRGWVEDVANTLSS